MKAIKDLSEKEFEKLLEPIQNFLVIRNKPKKADVIFVFGSVKLPLVHSRVLELYQRGYAPHILISGGIGSNNFSEGNLISEAEIISNFLIKNKVPESAIIKEAEATNTLENVKFGIKKLDEYEINHKCLILVAKPSHMRRCVATFQKQYPKIELICCPPEGSLLDLIDRPKREFAYRSIAKIERLINYAEKGDISKQDIPNGVFRCIEEIKKYQ